MQRGVRLPDIDPLRAARGRVAGHAWHTPLVRLDVARPEPVFAKPESLQRTGSFKIRGASNFLARMDDADRRRGVVTHSSGNHGQAVAAAAHAAGVPATVVIPEGAATVKVERTRAWGAEVLRCGPSKAEREGTAERVAAERGATVVPPYDHPWIVEGQASVGLELIEDLPDVANVLVPVGGGGLIAGVAAALRASGSRAQVLGVEPELAADAAASFARGEIVAWDAERVVRTVADGVRTQALGEATFPIIAAAVDGFVQVSEEAILDAAAWAMSRARLVLEPTGALALAAYDTLARGDGPARLRPGPTALVLSGGNADPGLLAQLAGRA